MGLETSFRGPLTPGLFHRTKKKKKIQPTPESRWSSLTLNWDWLPCLWFSDCWLWFIARTGCPSSQEELLANHTETHCHRASPKRKYVVLVAVWRLPRTLPAPAFSPSLLLDTDRDMREDCWPWVSRVWWFSDSGKGMLVLWEWQGPAHAVSSHGAI